jgi:hypothetical protein
LRRHVCAGRLLANRAAVEGNVFIQFVDVHQIMTVITCASLAAVASGVTMAIVSVLKHRTTREDRWLTEGRARKGDCYKDL